MTLTHFTAGTQTEALDRALCRTSCRARYKQLYRRASVGHDAFFAILHKRKRPRGFHLEISVAKWVEHTTVT